MSSSASAAAPALLVDDVSKGFVLPHEKVHTIKERALHPFRRSGSETLHALSSVSFDVAQGEFFGIVGRNGSGKSTLLKCMAGIYGTDTGRIYVNGRLSAFIELGVGFNMDLPAHDNILLNATMLGLSAREARGRIDAVLDFAELREFADLKVKNYSSGMLVRLAFSVMIQVDADILLIDEVLAVGDANFQVKCYDQFEKIRRSGKTVLLVTHDMNAVRRFCDRAMLLERGNLAAVGDPQDVGNRYLQLNFSEEAREVERVEADRAALAGEATVVAEATTSGQTLGDGGARITEAWFEDGSGAPQLTLQHGERYAFCMRVEFDVEVLDPLFSMSMANAQGHQILSLSSVWTESHMGIFHSGETVTVRFPFDNILAADRYAVSAAAVQNDGKWLQFRDRMFSVLTTSTQPTGGLVDVHGQVSVQRGERAVQGVSR